MSQPQFTTKLVVHRCVRCNCILAIASPLASVKLQVGTHCQRCSDRLKQHEARPKTDRRDTFADSPHHYHLDELEDAQLRYCNEQLNRPDPGEAL